MDSSPITPEEKKEAEKKGPYMLPARPESVPAAKPTQKDEIPAELGLDRLPTEENTKGPARFGVTSYVISHFSSQMILTLCRSIMVNIVKEIGSF